MVASARDAFNSSDLSLKLEDKPYFSCSFLFSSGYSYSSCCLTSKNTCCLRCKKGGTYCAGTKETITFYCKLCNLKERTKSDKSISAKVYTIIYREFSSVTNFLQ